MRLDDALSKHIDVIHWEGLNLNILLFLTKSFFRPFHSFVKIDNNQKKYQVLSHWGIKQFINSKHTLKPEFFFLPKKRKQNFSRCQHFRVLLLSSCSRTLAAGLSPLISFSSASHTVWTWLLVNHMPFGTYCVFVGISAGV